MLVFGCLTLFFVKVSPVEIKEQILRLIFDKGTFFVGASIELNFKVKLLVKGSVKIACSRVQDQACEIVDYGLFFLHCGVVVVLHFCTIEKLFDRSLLRVEN